MNLVSRPTCAFSALLSLRYARLLSAAFLRFFVGDYLTRLAHVPEMERQRGVTIISLCVPLGILASLVIGIASAILVRRQGTANNLSCSSNFSRHRLLRFRISLMVTTFGQVCTSTIGNPNSHSSTGAPSQKMPNRSQSGDVLPCSRMARADRSSHRSVMRGKRRSSSS